MSKHKPIYIKLSIIVMMLLMTLLLIPNTQAAIVPNPNTTINNYETIGGANLPYNSLYLYAPDTQGGVVKISMATKYGLTPSNNKRIKVINFPVVLGNVNDDDNYTAAKIAFTNFQYKAYYIYDADTFSNFCNMLTSVTVTLFSSSYGITPSASHKFGIIFGITKVDDGVMKNTYSNYYESPTYSVEVTESPYAEYTFKALVPYNSLYSPHFNWNTDGTLADGSTFFYVLPYVYSESVGEPSVAINESVEYHLSGNPASPAYQEAWDLGYGEGYGDGVEDGDAIGFTRGKGEGIIEGMQSSNEEIYNTAYEKGSNDSFTGNFHKWIVPAIILVLLLGGAISIVAIKKRES